MQQKQTSATSSANNSKKSTPWDLVRETMMPGKRDLTEEELASYQPVLTDRILSMVEMLVPVSNLANVLLGYGIDKKTHHAFLRSVLPRRKMPYAKYIKKPDGNDEVLRAVMKVYEVGRRDAEEIAQHMDPEKLERLVGSVSLD